MPTLQVQARALGDPSRHAIFRYLADRGAPADVAELTAHLGLHHNAIRQHVAKLVEAGLVVESVAPSSGRGRPRLLYALDPSADSRWGVAGPYERLAAMLTEVVRSGDSPEEVGRRAGRRLRLGGRPTEEPVEAFAEQMARQGFAPAVRRHGDRVEFDLQACPFTTAVLTDPGVICSLHLGLARGVAEAVGGLTVDQLLPNDPRRAHCRLECRLSSPGTTEASDQPPTPPR